MSQLDDIFFVHFSKLFLYQYFFWPLYGYSTGWLWCEKNISYDDELGDQPPGSTKNMSTLKCLQDKYDYLFKFIIIGFLARNSYFRDVLESSLQQKTGEIGGKLNFVSKTSSYDL